MFFGVFESVNPITSNHELIISACYFSNKSCSTRTGARNNRFWKLSQEIAISVRVVVNLMDVLKLSPNNLKPVNLKGLFIETSKNSSSPGLMWKFQEYNTTERSCTIITEEANELASLSIHLIVYHYTNWICANANR